ncbi:hypothetical protein P8452_45070 [Trifolium repens]|nr:hypothetical protein P8452_45070 [Trifolium repens]
MKKVEFVYVNREANDLADALAKMGSSSCDSWIHRFQDVLHLHDVLARVSLAKLCCTISRVKSLDDWYRRFMKEGGNRIMAQENDGCQVFTLNENKTPAKRSCHDTLILVALLVFSHTQHLNFFTILVLASDKNNVVIIISRYFICNFWENKLVASYEREVFESTSSSFLKYIYIQT